MEKIKDKLIELRCVLEKAMQMPTIKTPAAPALPNMNIDAPPVKQPTITPNSKKDPTKVAQQTQDIDARAQALNMAKEKLKLSKNGQWSL